MSDLAYSSLACVMELTCCESHYKQQRCDHRVRRGEFSGAEATVGGQHADKAGQRGRRRGAEGLQDRGAEGQGQRGSGLHELRGIRALSHVKMPYEEAETNVTQFRVCASPYTRRSAGSTRGKHDTAQRRKVYPGSGLGAGASGCAQKAGPPGGRGRHHTHQNHCSGLKVHTTWRRH